MGKRDKILILGNDALANDIERQFVAKGAIVERRADVAMVESLADVAEVVLLDPDNAMGAMARLAEKVRAEKGCEKPTGEKIVDKGLSAGKLKVHLMVGDVFTLLMLRRHGLKDEVARYLDVYPFSLDDEWGHRVRLDHQPITLASEARAHLVIFGSGDVVELIAINAALKAHFPNYTRKNSLRTRITFIAPDADRLCNGFRARYRWLAENSYYRVLDADASQPLLSRHEPMYNGLRDDFVDVEWEFVKGTQFSPLVIKKLDLWSTDPRRQLTVVMAANSHNNLEQALDLPPMMLKAGVPIYVWMHDASMLGMLPPRVSLSENFIPIGMRNEGYNVDMPMVEMAKTINYIYNLCFTDNLKDGSVNANEPIYAIEIDFDDRERLWENLPMVKRMSSLYNAMTIPVKLRSVGVDIDDMSAFYDLSMREINLLAEVEHNRWSVEELILGYRPCTREEDVAIANNLALKADYRDKKIHYDLRSYAELRSDTTGRNVNVYDLCLSASLPLIASKKDDKQKN